MPSKIKYFFKLYYIAKEKYYGSQRQENVLTIENAVIDALKDRKYLENVEEAEFEFASRTDRYVSARGAVFSLIPKKEPILMEINSFLPEEIGLWAYSKVPLEYSPRFNALSRHYRYIIPVKLSYLSFKYNFNLNLFKKASAQLEGAHDFQNFSKRDDSIENTKRTLDKVKVYVLHDTIIIDFISQAFLRQQIRRMIQKLLEVGKNEISYNDFLALFDASKFVSYQPASPKGLILWEIKYDSRVSFHIDEKSAERRDNYFFQEEQKSWLQYKLFSCLQQDNFS
ncbi:MAG: tRNA pseudouridine(38-40) synthase TruA [Candidatus Lokiarchaeota archaeon]|nr:tRNA pseudouridine(38-40) synthase TruA [Candidatus Lokiarchaeota archaeon]